MTEASPLDAQVTAVLADQMNRLRGRLLGMVEAVGFPPDQESAIKRLLKSLTYDAQADLAQSMAVSGLPRGMCQCGGGEPTLVVKLAKEGLAAWEAGDDARVEAVLTALICLEKPEALVGND